MSSKCVKILRNGDICNVKTKSFVKGDYYCSKHKNLCLNDNCTTSGTFDGYCKKHSQDRGNFIRSEKGKYCVFTEGEIICQKRAIFGNIITGKKQYLYCKDHKKDDSINMNKTLCIEEGCNTIANYGVPADYKSTHCLRHKTKEMVVKYKTCENDVCTTKPIYGTVSDGKLSCAMHKKPHYIKINICKSNLCKTLASYGENLGTSSNPNVNKNKFIYCDKHSLEGYITVLTNELGNMNVEKPIRAEIYVKGFLEGRGYDCIHNSRLVGTYTVNIKRPDFLFKLNNCTMIVEVDEKQHSANSSQYSEESEIDRIREFYNDLGDNINNIYKPLYVVRINPDSYKDINNIEQNTPLKDRMNTLCINIDDIIKKDIENTLIPGIHIYYNYFDHYKPKYSYYEA